MRLMKNLTAEPRSMYPSICLAMVVRKMVTPDVSTMAIGARKKNEM